MGVMDDKDTVSDARFSDLKDMISMRFDDTNARLLAISQQLDSYETKEHARSELSHLSYRCDMLEQDLKEAQEQLKTYKESVYRRATMLTTILSSVVSIIFGVLQLALH